MSRWEPNTRERLLDAALDLFGERGYDSVTVAEIAERAGLTKRTFFRHFSDKREVLFAGQDVLSRIFAEAIADAPASASPAEAVAVALTAAAAAMGPHRRARARQVRAVVAGHTDLRERELLKLATLRAAMADALRARGVPDPTAALAAEIGGLAFSTGFARWVAPDSEREFTELVREALDELLAATTTLG
ncbi:MULTISPECIES: helix-turn-helix domain-containing protein [unclassified Amycolatopsis]|uniref:TetR/AcrR family transcriptional regulator n=1 Tax=unclassified Amycolatopsis TaxID=2618356 RepID=UPI002876E16D|nr:MULTISPECIES: helix-turn-helix domain-containing protein [unclassified Amycolatopsis]MDS0135404.1 TetR/AcrR family transcriptional regulator [Amycolatopsis sp. 505]MDS0140905.1 TetR/AcrR family transcriptional regulator [Amycolatopsis sp. CM201R]